ncbi:TPA: phage Gp19/Gp15/Gp42 family protein [Streptococcus equi subsp. zooepidemicus]|nr:phage Gp19/Gp15/Gp42 family protein [Streptococcus equi subsp. zooepidemicus]
MANFATTDDVILLWRPLSADELKRANALLKVVSDTLRMEADKVGKDLDKTMVDKPYFVNVIKSVTVDIVARTLMTSTQGEPMAQESQSALGYTWSGTYLVPGGGLFIKDSELKRLGLKKQRYGGIELYGEIERDNSYFSRQDD